jgi:sugar phosphate permease
MMFVHMYFEIVGRSGVLDAGWASDIYLMGFIQLMFIVYVVTLLSRVPKKWLFTCHIYRLSLIDFSSDGCPVGQVGEECCLHV